MGETLFGTSAATRLGKARKPCCSALLSVIQMVTAGPTSQSVSRRPNSKHIPAFCFCVPWYHSNTYRPCCHCVPSRYRVLGGFLSQSLTKNLAKLERPMWEAHRVSTHLGRLLGFPCAEQQTGNIFKVQCHEFGVKCQMVKAASDYPEIHIFGAYLRIGNIRTLWIGRYCPGGRLQRSRDYQANQV